MLLFESPSPQPRIAIKLPRIAGSTSALEHEAFCLRSLRESARAPLEGLPNVLFETDIGGVRAVGLTAFHGVPVFSYLDSWSFRQTSLRVTHWLVALARRRAVRDINTVTGNLCSDFRERFGAVANPADLRRAEAALARIGPLPVVCEQRDFSPWNVLATREGSLAVLDWESAELNGIPALDLIYFLTHLTFFLDRAVETGAYRESYRRSLDPDSPTGRVHHECMERYASALGIPQEQFHALRLLTWMLHSRSEYKRLESEANGVPTPESLEGSLFYNLWLEELEFVCNR